MQRLIRLRRHQVGKLAELFVRQPGGEQPRVVHHIDARVVRHIRECCLGGAKVGYALRPLAPLGEQECAYGCGAVVGADVDKRYGGDNQRGKRYAERRAAPNRAERS